MSVYRIAISMPLLASFFAISFPRSVIAGFANFDSLPEGPPAELNESFTTGGITFFAPDAYLPPPEDRVGRFVIEAQFDTPRVGPPFSTPNALTLGGYVPDSGGSGGRLGEFWATTGKIENKVSMDIFANVDYQEVGNVLTLEAHLNGAPVASTSVVLDQPGDSVFTMSLTGVDFDEVRLFSMGDAALGAWFGMIDNVLIGEPEAPVTPRSVNMCGVFTPVTSLVTVSTLLGMRMRNRQAFTGSKTSTQQT